MRILVTGATGYLGGRLVPRLLELGHEVTVLVRDPSRIELRSWANRVRVIKADLIDRPLPEGSLDGMDAAYYLIHALDAGADFAHRDRKAVDHFIASAQGVKLVVYLGGLLPPGEKVSDHLRSRAEVGERLRAALPTTEFRAGPIIGSGSASFEMVRYLTERLPIMIAPRWIKHEVQPIAVRDILSYLLAALDQKPLGVVDVGGNRLKFVEMMQGYAAARGLTRRIIPVPVLAPRLAALWVGLVTPIPNRLAIPLIEGITTPVVADTERAQKLFPGIRPLLYGEAVRLALEKIRSEQVETRWSGALGLSGDSLETKDWEGVVRETRTLHVEAKPEAVFEAFCRLGGDQGWQVWEWAWQTRGFMDKLAGGPGLRRGRRSARTLLPGEALDFWRVEKVVPGRLLRLRAEMKMPGYGWLQFEAEEDVEAKSGTRLMQTALFHPNGLVGTLYWYSLYPIHRLLFSDLIRAVARDAVKQEEGKH